jgi:hypothetical protein
MKKTAGPASEMANKIFMAAAKLLEGYRDEPGFSDVVAKDVRPEGVSLEAMGGLISGLVARGLLEVEDWESNGHHQFFLHLTEKGWAWFDENQ